MSYLMIIIDFHVVIIGRAEKIQKYIDHKETVHELIYDESNSNFSILAKGQQVRR